MRIKAVLLDFSGTIFDDLIAVYETDKLIAPRFGAKREVPPIDEFRRHNNADWRAFWKEYFGLTATLEIVDAWTQLHKKFRKACSFFPGALDFLHELKRRKYRLCMISSIRRETFNDFIRNGEESLFDALVTEDDVGAKLKPDPYPLLLGCERLGIKPRESAMVGDMVQDMQAGRAAGCAVNIAVNWGYHPVDMLELVADVIVDSYDDILEIVSEETKS
jgi:HAD superfamily hydrolase (TIGR01549 family)